MTTIERLKAERKDLQEKNAPDYCYEHIYRSSGETRKNLPRKKETWKERLNRFTIQLERKV